MTLTKDLLAPFADACAMRLETRKRDGTMVATPVNVAVEGDHAFFRSFARSGKAKRIRNFADVVVAPCTWRGRPTGTPVEARATLLHGERDRHAAQLIEHKHPILHGTLVPFAHRLQGHQTQHYELTEVRHHDNGPARR